MYLAEQFFKRLSMFKKIIIIAVLIGFVVSCKKDDDNYVEQLRDRNQQFVADSIAIFNFLNENYLTVDENYQTTFYTLSKSDEEKGYQSIFKQKKYPLQNKMVNVDGVNYKIYYLKLNEGLGQNPTAFDSILVSYKGNLLDKTQFDWKPNAFWSAPGNTVNNQSIFSTKGSVYIIPEFKSGSYEENTDGTMNFYNYGSGVMFLPSGLGYFNYSQSGIPSYSPVIVSFNLYDVKHRDHDADKVLSKFEDINKNGNFYDDDTDGDGKYDFLDDDDDGDGIPTKNEVMIATDGKVNRLIDDNDNGIPNYLDKEDKIEYNK